MKKHIKIKIEIPWLLNEKNFLPYQLLCEKYDVEISNNPDYLFFDNSVEHDFDTYLKTDCIKIFYSGESTFPDFNLCDYAIGFNTFNFNNRYLQFPVYVTFNNKLEDFINLDWSWDPSFLERKFCSTVITNARCAIRNNFYDELSKYKKVDSGGEWKNNVGGPVKNKYSFQNEYKFCICFENNKQPGYTTEKLIDAFFSKSLPIYWGNPEVVEDFNEKCFIYVKDKKDFNKKIELIKEIDNNDSLYKSYWDNYPLNDKDYFNKKIDELKRFLYNIFDKDIEDAKQLQRWDLYYHYQDQLLKKKQLLDEYSSDHSLLRYYCKLRNIIND